MKFYTTSQISENLRETPEGYLICLGVAIARTGEMIYAKSEMPGLEADADGRIVVTRDPKDVFRPETIASFEGKPVTIGHPSEFASPDNWKQLTKGIIQNVRKGEGEQISDMVADLLITDQEAIGLVKSGLREVSCGYDAVYVQTGAGRASASEIEGNHLALVQSGRAGTSYAIKDHKGKGSRMKVTEKIKAIFARAQDEALKVADESAPADVETKAPGYDELMKAVKDLGEKVGALKPKKSGDATVPATPSTPAATVAGDAEVAPGLEDRLKKLEDMVAKLIESQSTPAADDDEESDPGEESEDAECDDEGEEGDKPTKTGDDASRIEILAPGLKAEGKNFRAKAIATAYKTTDGKAVIDQFTGGKAPDVKNQVIVDTLFVAVSEVLKTKRASELARTKTKDSVLIESFKGKMTPEKINEMNAKRYAGK